MSTTRTAKVSFSAGEVSPALTPEIETVVYKDGLKKCENYIVDVLGGIKNRPGTHFIGEAYEAAKKSRLIPFEFNEEQAYVLEFGDTKMRVLKDGGLVGAPTVVSTPYSVAEAADLQYTQSADTLYLFHPDHKIGEVTRTSDTAWSINAAVALIPKYPWKDRALFDEDIRLNITYIGLIAPFYDDEWEIISSSAIFADTLAGDAFKIGFPIPGQPDSIYWKRLVVKSVTDTSTIRVRTWDTGTAASPARPLTYQQILNSDFNSGLSYWEEFSDTNSSLTFSNTNQTAVLTDGATGDAKMQQAVLTLPNVRHTLRVKLSSLTGATPQARISVGTTSFGAELLAATAITDTSNHYYYILPTQETIYVNLDTNGSTDADVIEVEIVTLHPSDNTLGGTPEYNTNDWRLTAWNDNHGYPKTGIISNQRMICCGNNAEPQKCWVSELGNYISFDFSTPLVAADGFSFQPSTVDINGIKWIVEKDGLKVGTAGAIWRVFAPSGGAISPFDIAIERDDAEGTLNLNPLVAHNAILITPRGSTPVLEMVSSLEARGFQSRDIASKAAHLFKDRRIVRWAFAKDPDSVIWVILDNGQLLGCTYHRRLDIWAWHKHTCPLGVGYADVVVIPNSSDDNIDDVYFLINRGTAVAPNYLLEIQDARIVPQEAAYGLSAAGTPYDYRLLDSGLTHNVPKVITNASQTNPVVILSAGHGFLAGTQVRIQNVVGMTELNNNVYTVQSPSAPGFELAGIDGTGFTAYESGGEAREMATALSGFDHLEGQTVTALADGVAREGLVVASGIITLPQASSYTHVGLPYTAEAETLDIEEIFQSGGTQGRIKAISSADMYFTETRGCKVSASNRPLVVREVQFEDEAFGEEPPPLFDGLKSVDVKSDDAKGVRLIVKQDKPYPQHLRRIILDVEYSG